MRRSDKRVSDLNRGFTLVELLVVLVILAIVAAIGIPALLGFIDKGKESEYKAHAEAALAATQTALTEIYNDAGNSFTPTKRNKVKALAGAADAVCRFGLEADRDPSGGYHGLLCLQQQRRSRGPGGRKRRYQRRWHRQRLHQGDQLQRKERKVRRDRKGRAAERLLCKRRHADRLRPERRAFRGV